MKQIFSKETLARLPNTTQRGLLELQANVVKMKHSTFSDDQFISQIERSVNVFSKILDEATCDGGSGDLLTDQQNSVEDAIHFINGAIINRLQSNRYLFEGRTFNPPNIGPFSNLYLFYDQFVDLFERLIDKYRKETKTGGVVSHLDFLIDITIHSSVAARLFVPTTCNQEPANRLIGITLNEQSFFNIKETIILILHEIGHYVMPADRKKRNRLILDILIDWQTYIIQNQLIQYLYPDEQNTDAISDGDKKQLNSVKEYFQEIVIPMAMSLAEKTLNDLFQEFIIGDEYKLTWGKRDPMVFVLKDFSLVLKMFAATVAEKLSQSVFIESKYRKRTKEEIVQQLKKELDNNDDLGAGYYAGEKEKYFQRMCRIATDLFSKGRIFEYRLDMGNAESDIVIDAYLKNLSLLGLNELSENNMVLFSEKLTQAIKISLEATVNASFLDFLSTILDETQADMFLVKTLGIKNHDRYWKLMQPLFKSSFSNVSEQKRYFGPRNAVMTEYFDLVMGKIPEEKKEYLLPLYFDEQYSLTPNKRSPLYDRIVEDLRSIVWIPIAEYFVQNDVYPDTKLFQQRIDKKPVTRDGKLVEAFRLHYEKLIEESGSVHEFANELSLINLFVGNEKG